MEKEIFYVDVKDCKLYCEKRGEGPLFVIVVPGGNDCEIGAKFADLMADEFTVVIFDPRGGSRSMPTVDRGVTAEGFADDIAAIIKHMDLGKATIYGCSSGGHGALMTGIKYPELVKNLIVHEAALSLDVPYPNAGDEYFKYFAQTYGPYMTGQNVSPVAAAFYVNVALPQELDAEANDRIEKNNAYWAKYYLGAADQRSYSKEELARIPACDFTVGAWSSAWLPYGNIKTAERGGFSYTWVPCSHCPTLSCKEFYADFCKKATHKYD